MEKKTYFLIGGGGDGADLYGGLMMEVPKMDPLGLLLHHHHHYHLDAAAANGNASPPSIPPCNKQSLLHFRFRLPTLSLFPQLDLPPLHVSNQPLSSPAPPFPSFSLLHYIYPLPHLDFLLTLPCFFPRNFSGPEKLESLLVGL